MIVVYKHIFIFARGLLYPGAGKLVSALPQATKAFSYSLQTALSVCKTADDTAVEGRFGVGVECSMGI
jgi:hypothetical protein